LGLHRVWCEIYGFDQAKQRLLPRLGFTLEGTIRGIERLQDRFVDHAMYGLLSTDPSTWRGEIKMAALQKPALMAAPIMTNLAEPVSAPDAS